MAAMMAGIAPVKKAVDSILLACKSIVQSGSVPGAGTNPAGRLSPPLHHSCQWRHNGSIDGIRTSRTAESRSGWNPASVAPGGGQ